MTYGSKIDRWLIGVLAASAAIMVWAVVSVAQAGGGGYATLLVLATLAGAVLLFALLLPVQYTIHDDRLDVQGGRVRWSIPLHEIEEVRPSRNPLSSPALSMDRLKVVYRSGTRKKALLISPRQKQAFMADLAAREAGLVMERGRLSRRP